MLLSYKQLMDQVVEERVLARREPDAHGNFEIDFNQVNSASIDILLGTHILVETMPDEDNNVLDFRRRDKMQIERVALDPENGYVLTPGQFILAESAEIFNLPLHLSCEYKLKSSMARIGLEHLNAGWCDAGWNGSVLTLELKNLTWYHSIRIRPGDAIGQMVFFQHEPVSKDRSYAARGRYNGDKTVSTIKE